MSKHSQFKRALESGAWARAEAILAAHPELRAKVDSSGRSLAGYAAEDGQWALAQWLLDRGWPAGAALDGALRSRWEAPQPFADDIWRRCEGIEQMPRVAGASAMQAAAARGRCEWIRRISSRQWPMSNEDRLGAWSAAMGSFCPKACSALEEAIGLPAGEEALADLAVEAFWRGRFEAAHWLWGRGLNPAARGSRGESLLAMACWAGRGDIAKWLLEKGAIVDQLDERGRTALARAVARGEAAIAQMLLAAGADPSRRQGAHGQGDSPMRLALRGRDGGMRRAMGIMMERACLASAALSPARGTQRRAARL